MLTVTSTYKDTRCKKHNNTNVILNAVKNLKYHKHLYDVFPTENCVKQENALLPLLFNYSVKIVATDSKQPFSRI
jgi:hypothetical protein